MCVPRDPQITVHICSLIGPSQARHSSLYICSPVRPYISHLARRRGACGVWVRCSARRRAGARRTSVMLSGLAGSSIEGGRRAYNLVHPEKWSGTPGRFQRPSCARIFGVRGKRVARARLVAAECRPWSGVWPAPEAGSAAARPRGSRLGLGPRGSARQRVGRGRRRFSWGLGSACRGLGRQASRKIHALTCDQTPTTALSVSNVTFR